MEISLDIPHDHLFVRATDERGIRVGDQYYSSPFILSTDQVTPDWAVENFDDITEQSLQPVFDLSPEVVLIGCGASQKFFQPAVQMTFFRRNIGFEVMITGAACRTFNVLASEGRRVVAALLPEHW